MNIKSILFICALPALAATADVSMSFANTGPVTSGTFLTAAINDTITLAYTIDGAGAVSLNASTITTNATFINLVNQFDRPSGTAGSTTNSGFFNTSFNLKVVPVRSSSPNLSITTLNGGGLGVQGQDSNRVDGRTLATSAPEALKFELTAPAGMILQFKNWSWVSGNGADMRFSDGTNFQNFANLAASGSTAFGLVANGLSLSNGGTLSFGETPDSTTGAGLGGFTFEILSAPLTANDAVASFANSGTGFGSPTDPTTTSFVSSGSGAATITLAFSINSAGVLSLNASTTSTTATFINMVNEWDRSNVGTVTNSAWFNTSFTLTGSGSGGGNLAITELGGGGIGIQGENSNRVDGLNYGAGGAISTPETLTWTLSGAPAGLSLSFKNWSYVEGGGGDIRVSNGTTNADFANMATATGTPSLPADFVLNNGGSLTFREIPGIGLTDGAGIAGFTFAVTAPPGPEGFDNGAGNNLWTSATNWSPDGVPASPADAIIDGYNVILDSAASASPDELRITNGSLTVTGSGALTMRAMTLGRDLTKTVRLVIHGSGVSFGDSGSSATDEFAVGSAATVETKPDSGGSEPLELGAAKLVLDVGSEWLLDGTNFTGPYNIGAPIVLANFGSLSGSTAAMRTRNIDLPST
ncbi:hypothetical protein HQ447_18670, partial [bacterium]|nr:hypothetical protein [bacterium]